MQSDIYPFISGVSCQTWFITNCRYEHGHTNYTIKWSSDITLDNIPLFTRNPLVTRTCDIKAAHMMSIWHGSRVLIGQAPVSDIKVKSHIVAFTFYVHVTKSPHVLQCYTTPRSIVASHCVQSDLQMCAGFPFSSLYSILLFSSLKGHWTSITSIFVPNSVENLKLNQYRIFQLILPMRFHFMRYFVNSIISRVSHRLLYCVFIEVDFEK